MRTFALVAALLVSTPAFAGNYPTWFQEEEFAETNLDTFRYWRSMLNALGCNDPRRPFQQVCQLASNAHNNVADMGMCRDNQCPFNELKNTSRFYFRVRYPEFREEYGRAARGATADALLQQITRSSLSLQDLLTQPPNT